MMSAAFSPEWLDARLAALLPAYPDAHLAVALSGGVDSVALLAALAAIPHRKSPAARRVRAIHVHHGLHPNAGRWMEHCRRLASNLGIPLTVLKVKVGRARGESIENAARQARYDALGRALERDEVLLTAHHQDDQLETVLLQLLRGAGIPGLAAMPELAPFAGGWLARPLLNCSRMDLEAWAREQGLDWVEDESNANEQLDRNYLRRAVLPLVRARWPGAAAAVSRSARHAAEARRLLDALALADVERAAIGAALSVQRLRTLSPERRRNTLRFWIVRAGHLAPDTRQLAELAGPLLDARPDANPHMKWNDTVVARHADILSIQRIEPRDRRATQPNRRATRGEGVSTHAAGARPAHAPATMQANGDDETDAIRSDELSWDWQARPILALPSSGGTLSLEPDRHGPLDLDALPGVLTVRARRGGESLRPHARARARKLKSLLQEARIPPAERERLPLLFANEKLIAVSDRWIDASVQATSASRSRARLRFVPLPRPAPIC